MKPFLRFFAERHLLAKIFTIMIILAGLGTLAAISRSQWPAIDTGVVFITTRYPGASPNDVEQNVTNKIEDELKTVTGIDRTTSISMENISLVTVKIEQDINDKESVKDEIREAVGRVSDFPVDVKESPYILESKSANMPIIEVGFSGDLPYGQLKEIARRFEKKLKKVPGVSRIKRYGYFAREIKVEVSPEKVREFQIPMREIVAAIAARNIRSTGGSLESYTSEEDIVTLAQFSQPVEVGDVVVRSTFEGPLIKVRDLAVINDSFEEAHIISNINGKRAISFIAFKSETADIIRTVDALKRLVDRERENLPGNVEILYTSDVSKRVGNALGIVLSNGLIGMAFIIIMLTLFLSLRIAFWVAMGIPISIMGVIFLLPIFNANINLIVLASMVLVIGIIVDDAIIIAENIYRRRELGDTPLDSAVNGVSGVFRPVLTTILTTIIAFLPVFFLPGFTGQVANAIPLVIILALLISFGESIIALPAHLISGLRTLTREKSSPGWFDKIREMYKQHFLGRVLRFRYFYVFLSFLLLLGTLWYTLNYMGFILFPSEGAEELLIRVELPTGNSLKATSEKIKEVEGIMSRLPEEELASYVTRIGALTGEIYDEESENFATIILTLTPLSERSRNADEIREHLRGETDKLNGFKSIVFYVHAGGPPIGKPVNISMVGSDDLIRRNLADDVEAFLGNIDGVKDIERDDKIGKTQVEVKIDYDKLARLDLTVADIAQNVRIAYDGQVVTSMRYGDEEVDFRVMLTENVRKEITYLQELLIPNRQGRLISLNDVASLEMGPGPSSQRHYDGERSITISADMEMDKAAPVDVIKAIQDNFDLDKDYPGMNFIVGGQAEETRQSMIKIIILASIALLGMYFMLTILFNSLIQPALVMMAVPFGFVGVIFAFALHGKPLSFFAMLGALGLAGVVVNDSLVLVSHINDLRAKMPKENLLNIVAQGAADRLRAILLTTLTTVVGLLPLAYGLGGYNELMAPLALALGYGLLFATPLTLVVVPSFYVIGNDMENLLGSFKRYLRNAFIRKI